MKANEAPEKIYLFENPISDAPDERWLDQRSGDEDIEYTQTDVLIEKVKIWLSKHFYDECYQSRDDEGTWIDADDMIEDLTKYMKRE